MARKKDNINIDSGLANRIPYLRGYEAEGIIEPVSGKFTKMYLIDEIKPADVANYDSKIGEQKMEQLLNGFPYSISYQFCSHNKLIDQKEYLSKVLINPKDMPELAEGIDAYNHVIVDNVDIGHNNVHKTTYFIIATKNDNVDEAITTFRTLESEIKKKFSNVYGIVVKGLSLTARLKIMYTMFNPGRGDFGKKIDIHGDNNIDLKKLKPMKLSSKDLVAPLSWNTSPKLLDYSILNKDTAYEQYVRAFFVNNIPSVVSASMMSDLTNVSSNMVFSIIYEPIDTELGLNTVSEFVKENTVITKKTKRDTIADRKKHAVMQIETKKSTTETDYFNDVALQTLRKDMANSHKTMSCTFTILLYAADLEALDRDTELLRISATKFACNVKSLDLQQLQGFQTCLPLCHSRVDVSRVVDIERLAILSPINIQDVVRKDGLYNGINAINDNLILLNRKNNVNLNGLISGVEHSGKTYQNKREIFNALISTKDNISIITNSDEYDVFAKTFGGKIVDSAHINIFEVTSGYGLIEDSSIFKSYFYDALFVALEHFNFDNNAEEQERKGLAVESEVEKLMLHIKENPDESELDILSFLNDNDAEYPYLTDALGKLSDTYFNTSNVDNRDCRLQVYKVNSTVDSIMLLDYLWNRTLDEKKKNTSNWIFIDPVDDILKISQGAEYFTEYLTKANMAKTLVTFVIQDSIQLVNNNATSLAFEEVVSAVGYAKLLNQGPIERKKYIDLLNIPNALVPHISNVEPGKGLILTSASNIAFDDSFLETENPFRRFFAKDIEQIVISEKLNK